MTRPHVGDEPMSADEKPRMLIVGGGSLTAAVLEILAREPRLDVVVYERPEPLPQMLKPSHEPDHLKDLVCLPPIRYEREWTHPKSPRKQKGRNR